MVEILWAIGCTLDQLLALDRDAVDMQASALLFPALGGLEADGLEAGDLEIGDLETGDLQIAVLAGRAWQALCDYLDVRDELPPGALFCEADGARLTRERAIEALSELAPDRGAHFFPDLFRGVFIHRALEAVDDPRTIELMVGSDLSAADQIEPNL
jgi:site-specific recombinase XerC